MAAEEDRGSNVTGDGEDDPRLVDETVSFGQDVSERTAAETVEYEWKYARLGLVLGTVVVLVGAVLVVLGFSGSVDITVSSGGANGHVVTGSIGLAFALVGALIIGFTKYRVTAGKK